MFYFAGSNYATLWSVKEIDKGVLVSFSTSKKRQDNGERVFSSWNGRAYSSAADFLKKLKRGDMFLIKKAKIERVPYEKNGEKIWNHNVVLFEVDKPDNANTSSTSKPKTNTAPKVEEEDNSDPWG